MKTCKTTTLLLAASLALAVAPFSHVSAQGGYDTPNKTDTFDAGPEVYHVQKSKPSSGRTQPPSRNREPSRKGPVARLSRGEIVQVFTGSRAARPELAFYLPREATSVAQLVVEKKGSQVNYFVKGLASGSTVGGAVQRDWLDAEGFRPRNLADEARIQAAVKRNPLYIEVR